MNAKPRSAGKCRFPETPRPAYSDIRVGPLLSIPSLLSGYGLDPSLVLAEVGLDAHLFEDPENRLPFDALGRLLETCVELTRCRHFGLLIGQQFKLESLGLLGDLMRNAPTLRDALRLAALYLDLQDRGAVSLTLDLGDGKSALGYSLFGGKSLAAEQLLDGAMAIHYLLLRELCGPSWNPVLVQLSHSRPTDVAPLQQFFRASLQFDAEISGIVFESAWLDHPIDGADSMSFAAISKAIESDNSHLAMPFVAQVRRALHAMMFTTSASSANLAQLFNLNERTLRRRLAEEGVTVRGLVSETRRELAQHLLRDTDLPVSEIAALLRYSDVTVFARAFRGWSNMSPREWRAQCAYAS
jgi:AraC-like DNA-binding protein